jgi:hypothetical protein
VKIDGVVTAISVKEDDFPTWYTNVSLFLILLISAQRSALNCVNMPVCRSSLNLIYWNTKISVDVTSSSRGLITFGKSFNASLSCQTLYNYLSVLINKVSIGWFHVWTYIHGSSATPLSIITYQTNHLRDILALNMPKSIPRRPRHPFLEYAIPALSGFIVVG